jgi:NADPH:quinone reductase-like Zn-dependent oxidoreductase
MLAIRKIARGKGNIEIQEVPEPHAGAGQVVIEVNLRKTARKGCPASFGDVSPSKHRDHSPIYINHLSVHEIRSR